MRTEKQKAAQRAATAAGKTHGMTRSREYLSWTAMKQRCLNPKDPAFPRYGGRGIRVCRRWLKFETFYADVGPRPLGTALDRKDNDGNYAPGNARWVTHKMNQRNRSNNRLLSFQGEELPLSAWAERMGINESTIRSRLDQLGWPVGRALNTETVPR